MNVRVENRDGIEVVWETMPKGAIPLYDYTGAVVLTEEGDWWLAHLYEAGEEKESFRSPVVPLMPERFFPGDEVAIEQAIQAFEKERGKKPDKVYLVEQEKWGETFRGAAAFYAELGR